MTQIQIGDRVRVQLTAYTDPDLARLASIWAATLVQILDEMNAIIEIRRHRFRIRLSALIPLRSNARRLPSVQSIPRRFDNEFFYHRQLHCHLPIDRGGALLAERRAA